MNRMKLVGLGGGIGSGKSSVSVLLHEFGAVIVDADLIARSVVEPGHGVLDALVERFGPTVLTSSGLLDRKALAELVFPDPEAVKALNAITHPAIGKEIERQIAVHVDDVEAVVMLDAPLLFERDRPGMVGKILVDVDEEIAVSRLVKFRSFDEADARRRVTAQMTREERRAKADFVIDNSGNLDALRIQVRAAWKWIGELENPTP